MFLTRIGYGIIYFLDLIYEIIKSTIDVAFNKIMRRDINPVEAGFTDNFSKQYFFNSWYFVC